VGGDAALPKQVDQVRHERHVAPVTDYKRIGEPEGIGRAAAWLASDDSDYIHGVTIFVPGGMTLYPGFETGGGVLPS
jgi:glucose 1-dehydrogenase